MNVSVRDLNVLRHLDPDAIRQYLQRHQWHESQEVHHASLWTRNGSSTAVSEVLLPSDQTLADFPRRMYELLETLEGVEGRSQLDILHDLLTSLPNTTVQGIVTDIREGATEGRVTVMGVVIGKLRRIQLDLNDPTYELAVKAYQARIPILCQGDLLKQGRSFILQHPQNFTLDLDAWTGSRETAQAFN